MQKFGYKSCLKMYSFDKYESRVLRHLIFLKSTKVQNYNELPYLKSVELKVLSGSKWNKLTVGSIIYLLTGQLPGVKLSKLKDGMVILTLRNKLNIWLFIRRLKFSYIGKFILFMGLNNNKVKYKLSDYSFFSEFLDGYELFSKLFLKNFIPLFIEFNFSNRFIKRYMNLLLN